MAIYKNNNKISEIFKNDSKIKVAYLGTRKFFEKPRWQKLQDVSGLITNTPLINVEINKVIYIVNGIIEIKRYDTVSQTFLTPITLPTLSSTYDRINKAVAYNNLLILYYGSPSNAGWFAVIDTTTGGYLRENSVHFTVIVNDIYVNENRLYICVNSSTIQYKSLPNLNTESKSGNAQISKVKYCRVYNGRLYVFGNHSTSKYGAINYTDDLTNLTFTSSTRTTYENKYDFTDIKNNDNMVVLKGYPSTTGVYIVDLINLSTMDFVMFATTSPTKQLTTLSMNGNNIIGMWSKKTSPINYQNLLFETNTTNKLFVQGQSYVSTIQTGNWYFISTIIVDNFMYALSRAGNFARLSL